MSTARHLISFLKSHIDGDEQELFSTALQAAAHEAKLGHANVARELRQLVDRGRNRDSVLDRQPGVAFLAQPRGELASLLSVSHPQTKLSAMVLEPQFKERLQRILLEQTQSKKLLAYDLAPRRKLLLVGPPGSGKTMTASAIAGELKLPLFTILLEGVITKYMGETAQKLRMVFDAIGRSKAVYLFDEFDAIGAKRNSGNDVGEIRRVLNSFLQLLENDRSQSIIVAATNHPELLDPALFRRFDDVLTFHIPDGAEAEHLGRATLRTFNTEDVEWKAVRQAAAGLSQADVVRASSEAAKSAVLRDSQRILSDDLVRALQERRAAPN